MKIALIGAGPRNLAILGRLIFTINTKVHYEVDLFDPAPIGGRVWNPFLKNNHTFLMNSFANQVTLFDDYELFDHDVPISRPNLLTWAQTDAFDYLNDHPEYNSAYRNEVLALVSSNTFASRGLFGVYANWYYETIKAARPDNMTINFHQTEIVGMEKNPRRFTIHGKNGFEGKYDRVVLAPGHVDNQLNDKQSGLAQVGKKAGYTYYPASHPAENDFSHLDEHDHVLIEGLGLSFFDVLLSLTAGKGGTFITNQDGSLSYRRSGHEPTIVAGSFNGLPPRSKGINQKEASQLYQPRFFTLPKLKFIAEEHSGKVPFDSFMNLLKEELTFKFLFNQVQQAVLPDPSKKPEIIQALEDPDNWPNINDKFGLHLDTDIDWQELVYPALKWQDTENFDQQLEEHINADIHSAEVGNDWSPLTGSYDLLRDMRETVRKLYNENYFDADGYQKMLTTFRQFDNQLSAGPPLVRMRQLLALLEAGVLKIAGPGFTTQTDGKDFLASDHLGHHFTGNVLVEARLSTIDFRISRSPLIQSLVKQGLLRSNDRLKTASGRPLLSHSIKVDLNTLTVIDKMNRPVNGFFVSGIPLEGTRWFNTVIPRPYVNTLIFQESKRVVDGLLKRRSGTSKLRTKKD
ncbi:FAD/NAD(P)-binding protein [Fructobacillus sp. M1-13]|uniref:FAD/NAD(P)-binding protein n=1 Tax=Fructobacillus papyriferae TaxID=2713171 RepID=A0ABS5QPP8_9LACO|nr:FAD/NAD(P)-binding protein [Fructobacillus papyriferae]MBS9335136.1 FAD/NAD(P)-binding protein [Fructobacillus papyriferae]MCD2159194.1 FAD/NAD(P)-binding protein [Fructobacillus papyriferae]